MSTLLLRGLTRRMDAPYTSIDCPPCSMPCADFGRGTPAAGTDKEVAMGGLFSGIFGPASLLGLVILAIIAFLAGGIRVS